MDRFFYHPLQGENISYTGFTNISTAHATPSQLDYSIDEGTPLYAICDGEIVFKGEGITSYSKGPNTYCVLKCNSDKNNLGETFYIRYLHGDFSVKTGQIVNRGEQIGTVGDHGNSSNPHLHIDFTWAKPSSAERQDAPLYPQVIGEVKEENGKTYFLCTNENTGRQKKLEISPNVKLDYIKNNWGNPSDNKIGYCWLVFAQDTQWKEPEVGPDDGVKIDRTVYDNHPGDSGHDNSTGVNAYFKAIFTEDFIGPPPNNWDDFLENWNLRCLVSFIRHETGTSIHANYWLYASAVTAKMMRATVLCHRGVNEVWGAANGTHNFKEWILTGNQNSTNYGTMDGYGIGPEHENHAWIGSNYINAGEFLVTEDPSGSGNILNEADLPWIQAVYNNFRYPDIYGNFLEPNIASSFKKAIEDFANGLVTDNYYDYDYIQHEMPYPYGYPENDMAFKAYDRQENSSSKYGYVVFCGYRHKSSPVGIVGNYNTYAYILSS